MTDMHMVLLLVTDDDSQMQIFYMALIVCEICH